jgi:peptidoglycan/xylan/chitin deacetylase (PgdA/CDA1 family)
LYTLLLVVFVAVGVGLFLSVRSGAETRSAGDGTGSTTIQATATSQGTAVTSGSSSTAATASETGSRSAPQTTATTSLLESASLPTRLPADAVKVHAPILMYHYVDDTPPPAGPYADGLTVRTNDFRAEMQYLVDNGYHTVTFADVYRAMAGLEDLPAKSVVLTFDDGGLDNYEVAFSILQAHGLTGTFFVITGSVGKKGQMTWDQLREMAARGMSVQSHSVSHPDLREVTASKLKSELADSSQAIADEIGESSYVFCYPSGAYNQTVIEAVRAAGYLMAVATDKGSEGDPSAVYEMKRHRVMAFLPLATFAKLVR